MAITMLKSGAESVVFAYIGLCTFTYASDIYGRSISFIGIMFAIIIVGRLISVFTVHFLFSLCMKKDVSHNELVFISYGGMIKGAIAFGLALRIFPVKEDGSIFRERRVIITTTLAVVIMTTVIFGTFMPLV
jgi:hypothetical protein